MDAFIPASINFVGYQEEYGTVGNNMFGAAPRHPIVVSALENAVEAINRGDTDMLWLSTGPGLWTRCAAVEAAKNFSAGLDLRRDLGWIILNRCRLYDFMRPHAPARYKSTSKHWSRILFERSRK